MDMRSTLTLIMVPVTVPVATPRIVAADGVMKMEETGATAETAPVTVTATATAPVIVVAEGLMDVEERGVALVAVAVAVAPVIVVVERVGRMQRRDTGTNRKCDGGLESRLSREGRSGAVEEWKLTEIWRHDIIASHKR